MSRVTAFSRAFPSYHPRKGEATHFVEQIWNGLNYLNLPVPKNSELPNDFLWSILPLSNYGFKYHTIRAGNRWKVGDKFSPRVWSGTPRRSKQIIIAPDIEIKKVWDIKVEGFHVFLNKELFSMYQYTNQIASLAKNDGLEVKDFWDWFPLKAGEVFYGQIICWNENIDY